MSFSRDVQSLIEYAKNSISDKFKDRYEVKSRLEEIEIYYGCSEPGYDEDSGYALGNWNDVRKEINGVTYIDKTVVRLGAIFEKLGFNIEWNDEWTSCYDCNKIVRTQPDCYSWTPSYIFDDDACEIICRNCVEEDPERILHVFEGNPDKALTIDIDLSDYGYSLLMDDLRTSMHKGETTDPQEVYKFLSGKNIEKFIFKLEYNEQFRSGYSVWVNDSELDELEIDLSELNLEMKLKVRDDR